MQHVGEWLESIGMPEYGEAFADNKIDVAVLPHLTDQDLKDLGIPLGHRRKMLASIATLAGPMRAPRHHAFAIQADPQDVAERRHVTVMFSDLVGSTALASKMDPEDLRDLISAYQKCVAEIVHRFDGFVAKFLGDGVLVFFGYPQAQEDDAERAVRAGLELVAAVNALESRVVLQSRVGIATGLVVVGDVLASGDAYERDIVGETPNFAARLQAIAEPNAVVICDNTRKLLGHLFELEELGPRTLKGIARPARAWTAMRPSSVASRFEALRATGLTALVGRDEERELLLRRWARAKSGEGQVVLLSGEAGIGKSRLTADLLEKLAPEPHVRLRYFCSPQHTNSAFYPIIVQMERAAELRHSDTPAAALGKLDALLAQTATSIEDKALIAELLSLPNDGRYPDLDLSPEQRRQGILDALLLQLRRQTRSRPILILFEDAHWSDPTTIEALSRSVDQIAGLRALLVVTFRPEFDAPWIGRPHVTLLTINRLAQREVAAMIDHLVGSASLSANLRQDIVERTDGIPLFVEEMTKAVLEAGSDDAAKQVAAAVPLPALAVPATLHASLMGRLDRLGAAKEIAQIGAAIGRKFSRALLAAVTSQPDAALELALGRLVAAGLLFQEGVPPHSTYLFKHALVQDAAYSTMLRKQRGVLHARIAETLENRFPEIAERHPEVLARHCTEAGLIEKASSLWGKAAQRSLERSALVEAAEQLRRALAQIAALPPTPALRREQIKLQVALITPLMHVKGYASSDTKAAAERARQLIEQAEALAEPSEDPLLLFSVLHSFWATNFVAFNGEALRQLARQFLALAEKQGATVPLMIGHRIMGSLMHTGDFMEGRAHLDRALSLYDPCEHRSLASRFGQDVRVAALSYRSWALWTLGYADTALVDTTHALKDARAIGQAATLMYALVHAAVTHIQCGDYATASAEANELVDLAIEKDASFWKALGMSVQGCVLALTGKAAQAVEMITSGITQLRSTGSTLWMPWQLAYLAQSYAELGQFDAAWDCVEEAAAVVERTNERWHEAEMHRMAGEIALLAPRPDAIMAETYFKRALAIAHAQHAKSWELRAAMSMARLARDQGDPLLGHKHLASVYGWFTEGFATRDLRHAKELLDELCDGRIGARS